LGTRTARACQDGAARGNCEALAPSAGARGKGRARGRASSVRITRASAAVVCENEDRVEPTGCVSGAAALLPAGSGRQGRRAVGAVSSDAGGIKQDLKEVAVGSRAAAAAAAAAGLGACEPVPVLEHESQAGPADPQAGGLAAAAALRRSPIRDPAGDETSQGHEGQSEHCGLGGKEAMGRDEQDACQQQPHLHQHQHGQQAPCAPEGWDEEDAHQQRRHLHQHQRGQQALCASEGLLGRSHPTRSASLYPVLVPIKEGPDDMAGTQQQQEQPLLGQKLLLSEQTQSRREEEGFVPLHLSCQHAVLNRAALQLAQGAWLQGGLGV